MRIKFSAATRGILAAIVWANVAAAHPGHGPADFAAQVSQPLAGPDHFLAFLALTSALLVALRLVLKVRDIKRSTLGI
jgi:hydrogenase/urease accessory protein HupE